MTSEVLIPKMKRIDKKQRKLKIPFLNILLVLFCTFLIIGSTFVNIDIRHYGIPNTLFSNNKLTSEDFIFSFCLIPQIPMIMFVCAVLGKKMASTSVLLYILGGLFIAPLFALGGGLRYVAEYGFGYIFAYIPAVIVAGTFLKKNYSFKNMIFAVLSGVLIIHLMGILYMTLIAIIKLDSMSFIKGWIAAQSGLKIIYDLIASFVGVLIGKYLHSGLKFIMG